MRTRVVGAVTVMFVSVVLAGRSAKVWAFASCTSQSAATTAGHWPDPANTAQFGTQKWEFDWQVGNDGLEVDNVKYTSDLTQPKKMVMKRGSVPFLPVHYPENPLTCAGSDGPHGFNDKLSAGTLDSTPFCCAHVPTTLCYVPDRPMMCSPLTEEVSSCAGGTVSCNGVCTGTQVDTAAPVEDGVGEVVSGASDADVVLTAQFRLGGYVFVQRWRFQDNGTIIPTMRLGGIHECQLHSHQIYFRFNVELGASGPVHEVLEQCGAGGCADIGPTGWSTPGSSCGNRPSANTWWRMSDTSVSGRAVILQTGAHEGNPSTFCEGTTSECGAGNCVNTRDYCALKAAEPTETFVANNCNDHLPEGVSSGATDLAFWYLSHVDHHDPCTFLPMCDPGIGTLAFGPTIRLVGTW